MTDTIFALSTLYGKSGIAMIRISGEQSLSALKELGINHVLKPRVATFCRFINPFTCEILDEGLAIYFPAPSSFTGEDIIELHLHGSLAVIKDMIDLLSKIPYLRIAEAGEFSKRAFYNNKLDLTQAEGLAMLIDSETTIQKKIALQQLGGALENLYEMWRKQLISGMAMLEALIDFPDDDVPLSTINLVKDIVLNLASQINIHLADNNKGEVIMRGIRVAIAGPPNAGKSSLLNIISKREVAIVSPIPGTTRDVIEVKIDLAGYPVIFSDTAGIRDSEDLIEIEGIKRTHNTLEKADIKVIMLDCNDLDNVDQYFKQFPPQKDTFFLLNKVDLLSDNELNSLQNLEKSHLKNYGENALFVSASSGKGVDIFLDLLINKIRENYSVASDPLITKIRYRTALENCLQNLKDFDLEMGFEIASEHLRLVAHSLGSITGRIDIEEILDEIFSSFCIGK